MAGLPDYRPTQDLGAGPSPSVRAIPTPSAPSVPSAVPAMPSFPDLTAGDRALSGFGAELSAVALKMQEGQQHTAASQGMEQFLTKNQEMKQQYVDDTDYENAETNYKNAAATAQRDALANISDPVLRGRTSLEMTRVALSAGNEVRTAQVARQGDINIAANDTLTQTSLNEAVTAPSPQERAAAIDRVSADLERLHAACWIDAKTAVSRYKAFSGQLDQADAMALVQKNPAAAIDALGRPDTFASLDPVRRESLIIAAQSKLDGNTQSAIVNAAAFHPEAASLSIGRVIAPDHAQRIFDNGIVQIESGGNNSAVSPKGALGASQIMPETAREVATALGRKDVAGLSDADLKAKLLSDPALNLQLGRAYWQQMISRYDGNVPLAAAAYNAGPGRADAWKATAEEKFGAGFSPAQLASVVDIKE